MTPGDLDQALADARRLRRRFAGTAPRAWTAATAAAELAVQSGHLALCLLTRRGADPAGLADAQRPITDAGDELADVLLAVLSITTLAGALPAAEPAPLPRCASGTDALLCLLSATGQLAEAAMRADGYRHQPAGTPPHIRAAGATAIAACEALAAQLGLDLSSEFRRMVADADAFLDSRGQPR